jgi:hypothetical protein
MSDAITIVFTILKESIPGTRLEGLKIFVFKHCFQLGHCRFRGINVEGVVPCTPTTGQERPDVAGG